ncbi:hypothetical protein IMZ48_34995 [Candidatus Bathyarchaeota archaeon]|nr:hypothetical protein [Candidatus Bathyarchaeota archaeon]
MAFALILLVIIALFFGVRATNQAMQDAGQPSVKELEKPNPDAGVEKEEGGPFRQ